jgi:Xaa-Pro aminopeptidase
MSAVACRALLASVAIPLVAGRGATAQPPRAGTAAAPAASTAPLPAVARDEFAARRRALLAAIPDSIDAVIVLGAGEPTEDFLRFDQTPDFLYLTGFAEPQAALVLVRRAGGGADGVDGTLFVQPNDPAREVWTGRRAGVAGARAATGLAARPTGEFRTTLDSLARAAAAAGRPLALVGAMGGAPDALPPSAQLAAALRRDVPGLRLVSAGGVVRRLRARKSPAELARVRRAVEVTVEAQRAAMSLVAPGVNEYEVQALIEYTFRRRGADRPSFATIVGSGPEQHHAALQRRRPRDARRRGGGDGHRRELRGYAADVTRTVAVNGRFTPAQREIYQLVRDAQAAAERAAVLGAAWSAPTDSARRTIARGLARLGLTEGEDATFDCGPAAPAGSAARQCPQWSLYYMHGLGHGIGLEVHDPEQAISGPPPGAPAVIGDGSAFTLEPGVYVRSRLLQDVVPDTPRNREFAARVRAAVARYANIGVRIEDAYVATVRRGVDQPGGRARRRRLEAAMRTGRADGGLRSPGTPDAGATGRGGMARRPRRAPPVSASRHGLAAGPARATNAPPPPARAPLPFPSRGTAVRRRRPGRCDAARLAPLTGPPSAPPGCRPLRAPVARRRLDAPRLRLLGASGRGW